MSVTYEEYTHHVESTYNIHLVMIAVMAFQLIPISDFILQKYGFLYLTSQTYQCSASLKAQIKVIVKFVHFKFNIKNFVSIDFFLEQIIFSNQIMKCNKYNCNQ